jgi:glycosyltransferase involved in cell wall biosynthesis
MRILIVADGRSPITRRWLQALLERGHAVSLLSSFPCAPPVFGWPGEPSGELEHFSVLAVAYSQYASGGGAAAGGTGSTSAGFVRRVVRRFRSLSLAGRYLLGPLSVRNLADRFEDQVETVHPELVHALRIPFEGMLASFTPRDIPLIVSIWGNDLTLHAPGSAWMAALTQTTLRRAQGLMADAHRDLRLAVQWGFAAQAPALVVPGSGGIRLDEVDRPSNTPLDLAALGIGPDCPLVINPRGLRPGSVRTDTFFKAIPGVLEKFPEVRFICPSLAGQAEAERWVRTLGIAAHLLLLPTLPQPQLWELFRRAQVFVSPSAHDGTPNSLLEAMACGCFPVAGDIESLREWIVPGVNGMLVPPGDAPALAEAICAGLSNLALRPQAASRNREIIRCRAASGPVMDQVEAFYRTVLDT